MFRQVLEEVFRRLILVLIFLVLFGSFRVQSASRGGLFSAICRGRCLSECSLLLIGGYSIFQIVGVITRASRGVFLLVPVVRHGRAGSGSNVQIGRARVKKLAAMRLQWWMRSQWREERMLESGRREGCGAESVLEWENGESRRH
jgi:hypothetical protein